MRTPIRIAVVVLLSTACASAPPAAPPAEKAAAPAAGASGTGSAPAPAAQPGAAAQPSIRVEYRQPKNPAHAPLQAELRDRQVLDKLAEVLSVVNLPRPLTLAFDGCDGTSNAWYEAEDTTITFCYEYVAEIRDAARNAKLPKNVTLQWAVDGPVVFVLLHETGHAMFDLLKVPVLGREEDAADYFAALVLLRMGKNVAFQVIRGAAWSYAEEARKAKLDESDYADVHGLNAQRYYNILCLAYGSDPVYFAPAVSHGKLPKERAEGCEEEFQQARFAVQKLVAPSIDAQQLERVRTKHKARWESGK